MPVEETLWILKLLLKIHKSGNLAKLFLAQCRSILGSVQKWVDAIRRQVISWTDCEKEKKYLQSNICENLVELNIKTIIVWI